MNKVWLETSFPEQILETSKISIARTPANSSPRTSYQTRMSDVLGRVYQESGRKAPQLRPDNAQGGTRQGRGNTSHRDASPWSSVNNGFGVYIMKQATDQTFNRIRVPRIR